MQMARKNMLLLSKDMSSQFSFSLQKCYLPLQKCYSAAQACYLHVPLLFNSNATYHVQVVLRLFVYMTLSF